MGLRTLTLPPELGGQGADSLTAAIVIEELAKADLGVSVTAPSVAVDVPPLPKVELP